MRNDTRRGWLRNVGQTLAGGLRRADKGTQRLGAAPRYRPHLFLLEDRLLPGDAVLGSLVGYSLLRAHARQSAATLGPAQVATAVSAVAHQPSTAAITVAQAPTALPADTVTPLAFGGDAVAFGAVAEWDPLTAVFARPVRSPRMDGGAADSAGVRLGLPSAEAAPARAVESAPSMPSLATTARHADGVLLAAVAGLPAPATPVTSTVMPAQETRIKENYGRLPLSFEANAGQADAQVQFLMRGPGYSLFLTATEAVMVLTKPATTAASATRDGPTLADPLTMRGLHESGDISAPAPETAVVRMQLVGANTASQVAGREELPGKVNYFRGNDPSRWHANVPTYGRVEYQSVYPGIDLVYYGNQQQLEYDFVVAPGADPRPIALSFTGADQLEVDAQGDLVVHAGGAQIRQHKPVIYQEVGDIRQEVAGAFAINDQQHVGFQIGAYDARSPLIIDPVIGYSTYLGGSSFNQSSRIAVDASSNAYVTGYTESTDFPTRNPLQAANQGNGDIFVTKLNATGTALIYSTYLGGSGGEEPGGIAVDASGNAYVTGHTGSTDFPIQNPLPGVIRGSAGGFVAKLNATGSALVYSTCLGGNFGEVSAIAIDTAGNAYVTGGISSPAFPIGRNFDAFVAKLNATGTALVFSTSLGGSGVDTGRNIAVDAAGNVYVAGHTKSTNFPTFNALQPALGDVSCPVPTLHAALCGDAFVAKLNATGTAFVYSTYLGGNTLDYANSIAVDASGNAYVAGHSRSSNFPTFNALQPALGDVSCPGSPPFPAVSCGDAFVAKLNVTGTALAFSTYLGGSGVEFDGNIALDAAGNAYVAGSTGSTNFPTVNPLQATNGGDGDAFVAKLNVTGTALVFSTYFGGSGGDDGVTIALDAFGNAYLTGATVSPDFPTRNPVQATFGGDRDAFVAKLVLASDTTPPTWPAGSTLAASNVGLTNLTLAWTAAQDDVGVTAYKIFKNGVLSATVTGAILTANVAGLAANTSYTFKVEACDAAGNCSITGPSVTVTTLTQQGATQVLINQVNNLVTTGVLNAGQGNSLNAKLNAAIDALNRGNCHAASGQLSAFTNEVNALIGAARLSPGVGNPLINRAQEIINLC